MNVTKTGFWVAVLGATLLGGSATSNADVAIRISLGDWCERPRPVAMVYPVRPVVHHIVKVHPPRHHGWGHYRHDARRGHRHYARYDRHDRRHFR